MVGISACDDSRMTLIQVFAESPIGQQGTRVDGQPEQVNRVLFVQSGAEDGPQNGHYPTRLPNWHAFLHLEISAARLADIVYPSVSPRSSASTVVAGS